MKVKKGKLYRFTGGTSTFTRERGTVIECTGTDTFHLYVVQLYIDGVRRPSSKIWWYHVAGDKYDELSEEEATVARLAQ